MLDVFSKPKSDKSSTFLSCSKQCWHHLGLHRQFTSMPMASCISLPEDVPWPKWVLNLYIGRQETLGGLQPRSDPQSTQDEIWRVNIPAASPAKASTLTFQRVLNDCPQWQHPLLALHLPNNLFVPKSLFLILVETQTKPSASTNFVPKQSESRVGFTLQICPGVSGLA